jgi:hypothetical protein
MTTTKGRRVASFTEIERPGDYFGPTTEYTSIPAVFFLKPNARDEGRAAAVAERSACLLAASCVP